jgi:hypothetical protein
VTKFALNANPGITASPSPGPNPAGWNNSAVTVTFTCVPGAAPIQSCSAPTTVSTEGASQVVTGTAVDTANNTASASDTVNLDLTAPVLTISNPANNATVNTPYVIVTGTLTDALSGPGSAFCGSVPATLTGTNFSCTVQLSSVSNSIVITGSDLAGNTASTALTVNVSMAAPTSLTVSPDNPNMIVGGTQTFTAVDQTGTTRPDATWSVSDTTVASFESSSPNTLVGNAVGTVTLTATVGSVTGQTTVTVLAGSSLAVGTVLWSAPPPSGYTTQQIVQAVPTANGPGLYAVAFDSNSDILVQALKADGEQLWQSSPATDSSGYLAAYPSYSLRGAGDNTGGLLLAVTPQPYAWDPGAALYPLGPNFLMDLNPQTGQQNWTYSASGTLNPSVAVGSDGTIYAVEVNFSSNPNSNGGYLGTAYLDMINGISGALNSQIALPTTLVTVPPDSCNETDAGPTELYPGEYGSPVVGPDGSVYLEVAASQVTTNFCTYTDSVTWTVSLLTISPGGSPQFQNLESYSEMLPDYSQGGQVGDVIPDGEGGVLATWTPEYGSGAYWPAATVADIGPNGTVTSQFSSVNFGEQFLDTNLVLSDGGTAFATDGSNIASFNISNLQQNWTYTAQSGDTLNFVAATSGGGVTINDSQLGPIQLDANGNPSQLTGQAMNSPTFSWANQWDIPAASGNGMSQIKLPVVVDGASLWASPSGSPSAARAASALDGTLTQSTIDPPGVPNCRVCTLVSPGCTTFAGTGTAYLILVGDQGVKTVDASGHVHDDNVGDLFKLSAQTEADTLQASGHRVVACRVSSIQQFSQALVGNGPIDGGVYYFGHGTILPLTNPATQVVDDYPTLNPGEQAGPDTNVTPFNYKTLSGVELGMNAAVWLNACNAALWFNGHEPIAQLISNQLNRGVYAYEEGMFFSTDPNEKALNGQKLPNPPDHVPIYMIPEGAPPKPTWIPFQPQ